MRRRACKFDQPHLSWEEIHWQVEKEVALLCPADHSNQN